MRYLTSISLALIAHVLLSIVVLMALACTATPAAPATPAIPAIPATPATLPTLTQRPAPTQTTLIPRILTPSPNFTRPTVSTKLAKYKDPDSAWEISYPSDWYRVNSSSIENPFGNQSIRIQLWENFTSAWTMVYDVHSAAQLTLALDSRSDGASPVVQVVSGKHVQINGYPAYLVDYLSNQGMHVSSEFRLKHRLTLFLMVEEDLFEVTVESDWDEWDTFESTAYEILNTFRLSSNTEKQQLVTPSSCEEADKIIVSDVTGKATSRAFASVSGYVTNYCSYPVDVQIKAAGFDEGGNIIGFGREDYSYGLDTDRPGMVLSMVLPFLHVNPNETVAVHFSMKTASMWEEESDAEKVKFVDIVVTEVIEVSK